MSTASKESAPPAEGMTEGDESIQARSSASADGISGKKRMADGKQTREEKRRKWEAKQALKQQKTNKEQEITKWIQENSHFAFMVGEQDVANATTAKSPAANGNDNPSELTQWLTSYFDIQENSTKNTRNASGHRLFIAEGTETIRLLIQQSHQPRSDGLQPIGVHSVFVKPSIFFDEPVNLLKDVEHVLATRKQDGSEIKPSSSPTSFKVLIAPEAILSRVAGFSVSRGVLACGIVPNDRNEEWLRGFLKQKLSEAKPRIRLLALDGICDTANLGSMVRCSSAFGVDAVVLSKDSCDCWYRRAIRVSMGHVFKVPVVSVDDLAAELKLWSSGELLGVAIKSYAAVLDTSSLLTHLKRGEVPRAWCCVMGNEGNGISPLVAAACSAKLRIDIVDGVDSLSVPIACGILLNGLRERETSENSERL